MSVERTIKAYSNFSFEDFLQDDYFIARWTNPTPELLAFWNLFKQNVVSEDFVEASAYMDLLHNNQPHLKKAEENELWDAILTSPAPEEPVVRRFTGRAWYAAATAAVILVFVSVQLKRQSSSKTSQSTSLIEFAQRNTTDSSQKRDQTILVYSDSDTTYFKEKNPQIVYQKDSILIAHTSRTKEGLTAYNKLITAHGRRSFLELEDGTKIWVNAGTTLTYPVSFAKDKREIYVDGEIFLDVAHQNDRPFIVNTRDMAVEVLGTRFVVSSYSESSLQQVILASGRVKVHSERKMAYLDPNQMFERKNEQVRKVQVDASKLTSWIHGFYAYDNESFGKIAEQLSRYYGIEIHCNPAISTRTFSGKLNLEEDLDKLLKGLSFSVQFEYKKKNNSIQIYAITS